MNTFIKSLVERAKDMARSGALSKMLEGVNPVLVRKAADEVRRVANRAGSPEAAVADALKNNTLKESVVGTLFASFMGLHYTIKLLKAIKDRRFLVTGTLGLPMYQDSGEIKRALHAVMLFLTIYFAITFTTRSTIPTVIRLKDLSSGKVTTMRYKWSGLNDYLLYDSKGNHYVMAWRGGMVYDLVKDDQVIMTVKDEPVNAVVRAWIGFTPAGWVFYGPDGKPRFAEVTESSTTTGSPFEGTEGKVVESTKQKEYIKSWKYFKG
jgi:hypothetical protein